MIIDNTQAKRIMCSFVTDEGIKSVILSPGHNVVDDVNYTDMLKHPGFNNKVEAGMLVVHEAKVAKKSKAKSKPKAKKTVEVEVPAEADAEVIAED